MKITPLRLSLLYFLLAIVWIGVADPLLSHLAGVPPVADPVQWVTRFIFILLSASIFYVILNWYGHYLNSHSNTNPQQKDKKKTESVGIWDWSRKRGKLFVDDEWANLLGYSKTELEPLDHGNWIKLIHPEDLPKTQLLMEMHHTRHYPVYEDEIRMKHKDGNWIWVLFNGKTISWNSDNEPSKIVGTIMDITEIKSFKSEFAEQQKRFEIAANITSDVIWEWKPKQNKLWWGEGIETVFGYQRDQYEKPDFWMDNIIPEDKNRVSLSMKNAKRSGSDEWQEEYWFFDAYGKPRRILDTALVLRDEHGEAIRMIGTMVDKTKEIAYEEEIKFQSYKFEMIAKSANDVLYDWNLENNKIWWSKGWQSKFDYQKSDVENTWNDWIMQLHPDDREAVTTSKNKAIENRDDSWRGYYRIKSSNGSYSFVNDRGYFLRDKLGNFTHMVGAISDITEDVQSRKRLTASEEQYRLLFDQNPIPMWSYDPETLKFVTVNQSALIKYGYPRKMMRKMHVTDLHPTSDAAYFGNALKQSFEPSHLNFKDCIHLTSSNEKLVVDISISEILYKRKRQRLVIALDITEQREAEEKAISAIIEGEERERQRIAEELHDGLGQYLSACNMNLKSLYEDLENISDKHAKIFETGLELLNYAISETRNIAQNLLPKAIQDYGLELAIESLINHLKINTGIKFTYYNNVSGIDIPDKVQINLYRILQEGINNAIRHGNPTTIDIQLVYSDNELLMAIEDNGIGFDMTNLSTPGIGLRSIKTRAGAMSADFDLRSNEKGTIISLVVPI